MDSDKYVYKLDWLARLRDYLQAELAEHLDREVLILQLGFLQGQCIHGILPQPVEHLRQAYLERIDVPAGDLHGFSEWGQAGGGSRVNDASVSAHSTPLEHPTQ